MVTQNFAPMPVVSLEYPLYLFHKNSVLFIEEIIDLWENSKDEVTLMDVMSIIKIHIERHCNAENQIISWICITSTWFIESDEATDNDVEIFFTNIIRLLELQKHSDSTCESVSVAVENSIPSTIIDWEIFQQVFFMHNNKVATRKIIKIEILQAGVFVEVESHLRLNENDIFRTKQNLLNSL